MEAPPARPGQVRRSSITILTPRLLRLEHSPPLPRVGDDPSEPDPSFRPCFVRRGSSNFPPRAPSPYPQASQLLPNPSETPSTVSEVSVASTATEGSEAAMADDEGKSGGEDDEEEEEGDAGGREEKVGTPLAEERPGVVGRRSSAAWLELKRRASIPEGSKSSSKNEEDDASDKMLTKGNLSAHQHWSSSCEGHASRRLHQRVASSTPDDPDEEEGGSEEEVEEEEDPTLDTPPLSCDETVKPRVTTPPDRSEVVSDVATLGPSDDTIDAQDLTSLSRCLLNLKGNLDHKLRPHKQPATTPLLAAVEETAAISHGVLVMLHRVLPMASLGALLLLGMRWLLAAVLTG